jgi:hypothetical protein
VLDGRSTASRLLQPHEGCTPARHKLTMPGLLELPRTWQVAREGSVAEGLVAEGWGVTGWGVTGWGVAVWAVAGWVAAGWVVTGWVAEDCSQQNPRGTDGEPSGRFRITGPEVMRSARTVDAQARPSRAAARRPGRRWRGWAGWWRWRG